MEAVHEYYLKICEVYAHRSTDSKQYYDCFDAVALWYIDQGKMESPEEYFMKACEVFVESRSYSELYAECLEHIAGRFQYVGTPEATEKYFLMACMTFVKIDECYEGNHYYKHDKWKMFSLTDICDFSPSLSFQSLY